jgi:hypothetical protein
MLFTPDHAPVFTAAPTTEMRQRMRTDECLQVLDVLEQHHVGVRLATAALGRFAQQDVAVVQFEDARRLVASFALPAVEWFGLAAFLAALAGEHLEHDVLARGLPGDSLRRHDALPCAVVERRSSRQSATGRCAEEGHVHRVRGVAEPVEEPEWPEWPEDQPDEQVHAVAAGGTEVQPLYGALHNGEAFLRLLAAGARRLVYLDVLVADRERVLAGRDAHERLVCVRP